MTAVVVALALLATSAMCLTAAALIGRENRPAAHHEGRHEGRHARHHHFQWPGWLPGWAWRMQATRDPGVLVVDDHPEPPPRLAAHESGSFTQQALREGLGRIGNAGEWW